jgi:hypothetical protein
MHRVMKHRVCRSFVVALSILSFVGLETAPALADVFGQTPGEPYFVKVTRSEPGAGNPEDALIQFELCRVESPDSCEAIGTRAYTAL